MTFNSFVGLLFYFWPTMMRVFFAIFDGGYFRHIGPSLFLTVSRDLNGKINARCHIETFLSILGKIIGL